MGSLAIPLSAAHWLSSSEADTETAGDSARLSALVLAASSLEHLSAFEMPDAETRAQLDGEANEIPPQWAILDRDQPFTFWLQAATVAEHRGALLLSARMLVEIARLVREDRRTGKRGDASTAECLALCWTRFGRIARTLGDLTQAVQWYEQARRAVRSSPIKDAYPQAVLGLSAAAINRGNIPRAARLLLSLLRLESALPAVYRIPAHQLMAVVRRKQRQHTDALLNVWAAFDLLTASDFRREQLIGTMAEIAFEAGDFDAAARGFEAVLQSNVVPLVRIPALWGAIRARLATIGTHRLEHEARDERLHDHSREVESWKAQRLTPATEVMVHLCDAELAIARGDVESATTAIDRAGRVAKGADYFERQFLIDGLRAKLDSKSVAPDLPSLHVTGARKTHSTSARHPALQRLFQLRPPIASSIPG